MTHNPDIKGAVIERFNISLKPKMFKYCAKNNTYHYLDVIYKVLTGYNISLHSTIGMPPSMVNHSNIYSVWQRMYSLWAKIPQGRVKFIVGIKRKCIVCQGLWLNIFNRDISVCQRYTARDQIWLRTHRLSKSSYRRPVLQLRACQVHCRTPEIEIDKLVSTRNKDSTKQHLFKWRGYN